MTLMPSDLELLREAAHLLEIGQSLVLCTVIDKKGHGPRDVGAKMVVTEEGTTMGTIGGGSLERSLVDECLKALSEHKSKKLTFNLTASPSDRAIGTGMICGGELTVLADVLEPTPRLLIVGAGHVSLPLAKLGSDGGFKILIIDDERKLATKERFPMAEEVIAGDYTQVLTSLEVTPRDYAVVAHGEPEHDYAAIKALLQKSPAYIGLLGSRKKAAILTERLKSEGINDNQLKRLHAPVGLDIGAETPEEIAVSILAQIIQLRHQPKAESTS
jgi:xanthine dehydrogenase accessory factor